MREPVNRVRIYQLKRNQAHGSEHEFPIDYTLVCAVPAENKEEAFAFTMQPTWFNQPGVQMFVPMAFSISAGHVVETRGVFWACKQSGWRELEVLPCRVWSYGQEA